MGNFLIRHAQSCIAALGKLCRHPIGSVLTIAVIGIALALPAGLSVVVRNGEAIAGNWETARDFSVYLKPGVSLASAEKLRDELAQTAGIAKVELISADTALSQFQATPTYDAVLAVLDDNPLPHTLVLRPEEAATTEAMTAIADELAERADVDLVQLDTEWVARLNAILDVARRSIWIAAVLLVGAVIVIVGNTIRLDIQHQRAEIEVAKLLGATDAFVRRPFLYTGFWYGLVGSLIALAVLALSLLLLSDPVARLSALYGGGFQPLGLDRDSAFTVLGGGLLAGLGGAWSAVARHLADIQPTV